MTWNYCRSARFRSSAGGGEGGHKRDGADDQPAPWVRRYLRARFGIRPPPGRMDPGDDLDAPPVSGAETPEADLAGDLCADAARAMRTKASSRRSNRFHATQAQTAAGRRHFGAVGSDRAAALRES